MQLTRFTDLGLRVLMYLACSPESRSVTIAEVAERFQVSDNHLVKVVHFMAQQGWLQTTRGKGGGIALAKPAAEFRLGQLVRALEQDLPLIDCQQPVACVLLPHCGLKQALTQALQVFFTELDRYDLAQLAAGKTGRQLNLLHYTSGRL